MHQNKMERLPSRIKFTDESNHRSVADDDNMSIGLSSAATKSRFGADRDLMPTATTVAAKEQRRVVVSKFIMLLVLALVATGLCVATFLLLKAEEEEDFKRTVRKVATSFKIAPKEEKPNLTQCILVRDLCF